MRLLDKIEKATKKLLKALETGLDDDPRFISRNAAEVRLGALGHQPEDTAAMIEKAKTEQRKGTQFVSARELRIPSSLRGDAWDALGGWGPNLNRLRSDLTALLKGIASARAAGLSLRVPDEEHPVALADDEAADDEATDDEAKKFHAPRRVTQVQWLMVGELADVFQEHKLRLSRTENSDFLLCVELVREALGLALNDIRSSLRSLPASIFRNEEDSSPASE